MKIKRRNRERIKKSMKYAERKLIKLPRAEVHAGCSQAPPGVPARGTELPLVMVNKRRKRSRRTTRRAC